MKNIKKLVDSNGNKQSAALKLGCTTRHVNRLIAGYRASGKAFFVHGNHCHKPSSTIPDEIKLLILDLYQSKYYEANLTHYQELLSDMENINVSISTITSILREEYIISPKAHRVTKKRLKKELKVLKSKTSSKKHRPKSKAPSLISTSLILGIPDPLSLAR